MSEGHIISKNILLFEQQDNLMLFQRTRCLLLIQRWQEAGTEPGDRGLSKTLITHNNKLTSCCTGVL